MIRVILGLLVITAAYLVGVRYGAPGWLENITAPGFEMIEKQFGGESKESVKPEAVVAKPATQSTAAPATANTNLGINQDGIDLIKEEEGLRLEAYLAGGRSYIGYGHQQQSGEPSTITEAQAEAYLRADVAGAENTVRAMVRERVNVNEFSAMVSFAYNIGEGAFSRSRVLAAINKGDHTGAAEAFLTHNTVGGQYNQVIYDRRVKERALFLKPV